MSNVNDNILESIKKLHGIAPEDDSFDPDITMFINSALLGLTQIGVGDETGFCIESGDEVWSDFVDDKIINESVRTLVYIKVRLVFDPPASQTIIAALKATCDECEWRIKHWIERSV